VASNTNLPRDPNLSLPHTHTHRCGPQTAVMARRRRRRRPGGHTTAVGSGRRRAPFSTDTASHTHTARSLASPLLTLSSARPFSNGIFRSNGAPASLSPASSSLTHARRMDGFCNQNADQLGSLAGPSLSTVYVCGVACAPASLPRVLLPHTCTQDGWFLQPKRRPARLPRRTVPSNCICMWSSMRARLSAPRVLLPHTCTQDGWFLQPKRRPARLPRRTVPSNCICRWSRMRARLPLHILLLHTQVSR
jgi:hypothetical protein